MNKAPHAAITPDPITEADIARFKGTEDENFEVPDDCIGKPFPLRKLAPKAVDILIENDRFTVSHKRKILTRLRRNDIKPTDPEAFYGVFLDFVEPRPAAALALETILVTAPGKIHKLNKRPATFFRAKNIPNSDFLLASDRADDKDRITLGLFFEAASAHYLSYSDNFQRDQVLDQWISEEDELIQAEYARQTPPDAATQNDPEALTLERSSKILSDACEASVKRGHRNGNLEILAQGIACVKLLDGDFALGEPDTKLFAARLIAAQHLLGGIGMDTGPDVYNLLIDLIVKLRDEDYEATRSIDAHYWIEELSSLELSDHNLISDWLNRPSNLACEEYEAHLTGLRDTAKHLRAAPKICQNLSSVWTEEIQTHLTAGNIAKVQALATIVEALKPVIAAISQTQDCLKRVVEILGLDEAEEILQATKAAAASLSAINDALEPVLSAPLPESLESAGGSLQLPEDTHQRALEFLSAAGHGVFISDSQVNDDHDDMLKDVEKTPEEAPFISPIERNITDLEEPSKPTELAASQDDSSGGDKINVMISPEISTISTDSANTVLDPQTSEPSPAQAEREEQTTEPPFTPKPQETPSDHRSEQINEDKAIRSHYNLYAEALSKKVPAIAAVVAEALSKTSTTSVIHPDAFWAASAARAVGHSYSPAVSVLINHVTALSKGTHEYENLLLFGATLRTAIFIPGAQLRPVLSEMSLGSFGPHLGGLQSAVAQLPYAFPPSPEQLAELSGAPIETPHARILRRLKTWTEETAHRSGPCQPSTRLLHSIVKPSGIVGAAYAAMSEKNPNSAEHISRAIVRLDSVDAIQETVWDLTSPQGSRNSSRLTPASLDYLERRTGEALSLLKSWQDTVDTPPQKTTAETRRTLSALKQNIIQAVDGLKDRADNENEDGSGNLRNALAGWLSDTLENILDEIAGANIKGVQPSSADDAKLGDFDRLHPATRRLLLNDDLGDLLADLDAQGIPDPRLALDLNTQAGAFATAWRLMHAAGTAEQSLPGLLKKQKIFAKDAEHRIRALSKRVSTAARLDFQSPERYPALIDWSNQAIAVLEAASSPEPIDCDELIARADSIENDIELAESAIREDQKTRVEKLRKPTNEEDTNLVLRYIEDDSSFEAIENRIARLRDGRAVADFDETAHDDDLMDVFAPNFVDAAGGADWPKSASDFAAAFANPNGPLATDVDRRENAVELMEAFFSVQKGVASGKPNAPAVLQLCSAFGLGSVQLSKPKRVQNGQFWRYDLRAKVRPQGWFLPPVFGSKSSGLYRMVLLDTKVLPEHLVTALDSSEPTFIIVSGRLDTARRHELASKLRAERIAAILIDETLVAFAATRRESRLQTVFACGLPYGRVEPYDTNAGALPQEMFFGREAEIERIMSTDYEGCLVHGGRQLGKSALLAHIEATHHDPENNIIVVRDQVTNLGLPDDPPVRVWAKIRSLLKPYSGPIDANTKDDAEKICANIKTWVSQTAKRRRVVVLLDEADEFISAESMSGFPQITKLKELMEATGRRFKIVFAGLHNVQRLHNVANSPLPHLQTPTVIGPLNRTREDRQAALELVTDPLRAAGFRLEGTHSVERILNFTNEYPSLVQEFMMGLVAQQHRDLGKAYKLPDTGPLWTIPDSDLFGHEGFGDIATKIREKFQLTLNLDVRYALVAYTVAHIAQSDRQRALLDGLRAREILQEAQAYWPPSIDRLDVEAFEVILDEMCDLGVLGLVDRSDSRQKSFCLRSPEVIPMLGSPEDIEEELLRLFEREPKPRYDRATHRRLVSLGSGSGSGSRHQYLPLTDLQLERLLSRDHGEPRIVCGLRILGLDRIAKNLARVNETAGLPGTSAERPVLIKKTETFIDFRKELDLKSSGKHTLKVVIFMPSDRDDKVENILDVASRRPLVKDSQVRPIILLDAAKKDMRDLATRRLYATEFLTPWGPDALRMHLRQIEANDLDTPELRKRILKTTGGIPDHVIDAVTTIRDADNRSAAADALDFPLPRKESLPATKNLLKTLEVLETYKDETPTDRNYKDLNELAMADLDADLETLVPDLQAMGLIRIWEAERSELQLSSLGLYLQARLAEP